MNKAVFLDRDNTINRLITERGPRETPIIRDDFKLLLGVKEAVNTIGQDWLIIVISNQPNLAKHKQTPEQVLSVTTEMMRELPRINWFYYCLHRAEDKCNCRKPKPGLFIRAALDWDIDLRKSWMIGDSESDIQAGKAAGCKTILVKGGVKIEDIRCITG